MSSTCDLCGQLEDERALQIYCNGWLCLDCSNYYSNEELTERGFIFENTKDEAIEKAESRLLKEIDSPFIEQTNGDFVLTDKAQDIFNVYLDEELSKCKNT